MAFFSTVTNFFYSFNNYNKREREIERKARKETFCRVKSFVMFLFTKEGWFSFAGNVVRNAKMPHSIYFFFFLLNPHLVRCFIALDFS